MSLNDRIWGLWDLREAVKRDDEPGRFAEREATRHRQELDTQTARALADRVATEAGTPLESDGGDAEALEHLIADTQGEQLGEVPCSNCGQALRATSIGNGQQQCPACGFVSACDMGDDKVTAAYRAPLASKAQGVADAANAIEGSKQARAGSVAAMADTTYAYTCPHCAHSFRMRDESRCPHCGVNTTTRGLREALPTVVVRR